MRKLYRLLKAQRINRVLEPAGAEIEMPEQLGGWLVEQKVAEEVKPPAPTPIAPALPAADTVVPTPSLPIPTPAAETRRWDRCCGGRW